MLEEDDREDFGGGPCVGHRLVLEIGLALIVSIEPWVMDLREGGCGGVGYCMGERNGEGIGGPEGVDPGCWYACDL